MDPHARLLDLIATHSFKLGDFRLSSGARSDYYIDCRTTTLSAEGGRLAGLALYDLIRDEMPSARAVGGLTMGADPLVSNIASASAWAVDEFHEMKRLGEELELESGSDEAPAFIDGFLVRKLEKSHGTGRRIEGFVEADAQVVIVDDVCTTGGSTVAAIAAAREAGMHVIGVLCLVDREQGGRAYIEDVLSKDVRSKQGTDPKFCSLFTANEIRHAHIALQSKAGAR